MKKRVISILLAVLMILSLLPTMAMAEGEIRYDDIGSGTADDPWEIDMLARLNDLADAVNGEGLYEGKPSDMKGKYFKLTFDTFADEEKFNKIIGNTDGITYPEDAGEATNKYFAGTFDGNGHTIALDINSDAFAVGLFSYLTGTVKNLVLVGSVAGTQNVGGICAINCGTIEKCTNDATISSSGGNFTYAGGICGQNYGTITNSENVSAVSGSSTASISGLAAKNYDTVANCYNTGNLSGADVSGVVHENYGALKNCFNGGSITASNLCRAVCWWNDTEKGSIANCYFDISSNYYNDETGITGISAERMKAASNPDAEAGSEPLVDLLNGYTENGSYPDGWLYWAAYGGYPVFTSVKPEEPTPEERILKVTKAKGEATEGTYENHEDADYYWQKEDGVYCLHILKNSLIISGSKITTEYISIEDTVTNITLNGLEILTPADKALNIKSELPFTIKLAEGSDNIIATKGNTAVSGAEITVSGAGMLSTYTQSKDNTAIAVSVKNGLTVKGSTVNASAAGYGIYCSDSGAAVNVVGGTLTVQSDGVAMNVAPSYDDLRIRVSKDYFFEVPEEYNADNIADYKFVQIFPKFTLTVTKANGEPAIEAAYEGQENTDYFCYVGKFYDRGYNCLYIYNDDLVISGSKTTDECISITDKVNNVTLNRVDIDTTKWNSLNISSDAPFTIKLAERTVNTIKTSNGPAVYGADITITGNGALNAITTDENEEEIAIWVLNALTIDGARVNVSTAGCGVYCIDPAGKIEILNGILTAQGKAVAMNIAPSGRIKSVKASENYDGTTAAEYNAENIENYKFVKVSAEDHILAVTKANGDEAIEGSYEAHEGTDYYWAKERSSDGKDYYELFILTNDLVISGDDTSDECICVDADVTSVTLNGVNIDTWIFAPFFVYNDGPFTVTLADDSVNTIKSTDGTAVHAPELTITGSGTLNIIAESETHESCAMMPWYKMTVDGSTVNVVSDCYGIDCSTGAAVEVLDGTLTVQGESYAMNVAPSGNIKTVTASENYDGTSPTEYNAANIEEYKYIKVETDPSESFPTITVVTDENGTVIPQMTEYWQNKNILLKPVPNIGYCVKSMSYNDGTGDHPITPDTNGVYRFTINGNSATVKADFKGKTTDFTSWADLQAALNAIPASTTATEIKLSQSLTALPTDHALNIGKGKNVVLDLNGFILNRGLNEKTTDGHVIEVGSGSVLTINDSDPTVDNVLYTGGVITGGNSKSSGGGIKVTGGTVIMNGGTIAGNYALSYNGAGIMVTSGRFIMNGGTITDNYAYTGGGISASTGAYLELVGGTITGNNALYRCGGIYLASIDMTCKLGGTVTILDNYRFYKLKGATRIMPDGENDPDANKTEQNIFLSYLNSEKYAKISLSDTEITTMQVGISEEHGLDADETIGISVPIAAEIRNTVLGAVKADNPDQICYFDESGVLTLANVSYLVTAAAMENGTVTASKAAFAVKGFDKLTDTAKTVTLTVTPDSGYRLKADALKVTYFDGEKDQNVAVTKTQTAGEYTFIMPAYSVTVSAEFEEVGSNVIVEVQGSHGTAVAKVNDIEVRKAEQGASIVFTAEAETGYHFKEWVDVRGNADISGDTTDNPLTVTMPAADIKLKAVFEKDLPTLTIETNGHGSIMIFVNGDPKFHQSTVTVAPGAKIMLMTGADKGYHFNGFTDMRGNVTISDAHTFTMPENDVKIKAAFTDTVNADMLDIIAGYYENEEASFTVDEKGVTINTKDGTTFISWDENDIVAQELPVLKDEEEHYGMPEGTYTAYKVGSEVTFYDVRNGKTEKCITGIQGMAPRTAQSYNIIVEDDGHGTAKAQVNNVDVTFAKENDTVTLIPTANDGYAFKEWQIVRGIDAITDNTFAMPANEVKIKAIFERVYNINIQTDEQGTVVAKIGDTEVTQAKAGASVTLNAIANEGYAFDKWEIVSGTFEIKDNSFTMPAGNVTIRAAFEKAAEPVAKIGDTMYTTLQDAFDAAEAFDVVVLLRDISDSTDNITIPEDVFLDLNHHVFKTTGKVTNNCLIILYQENADIIDYLLYNVPGMYSAGEELKLPNTVSPDYIVPSGTVADVETGEDPAYQELGFAVGDESLVWNKDVPAGMQLDAVYDLDLGGDILGAKTSGIKPTTVSAVHFKLNDDITIGGNDEGEGEASLVVKSLYDEDFGDVIGTFNANGKTITLNKSGKLILSSDITLEESVLISGMDGMIVVKQENKTEKTVTYSLGVKGDQTAPGDGEGYTVDRENGRIIPEKGYEVRAEIGKFHTKELPLRFNVPYYVRKAETDTLNPSEETEFIIEKGDQTAPTDGEGYTVDRENGRIIPKEGYEIREERGEFGTTELALRFNVPYFVRKAETDKLKASEETGFVVADGNCEYTRPAKLTEGTFGLKLGGKDVGRFTFTKNGTGWNIQNKDGKYLAAENGKLIIRNTPFAWNYSNGAFSTSVKTTQKSSGFWFGFLYIPTFGCKTTTTTYYLNTVNEGALSTCSVNAELYETVTGEHEFGAWTDCKDGKQHKHVCKNCGEVEYENHDFAENGKCKVCGAIDTSRTSIKVSVVVTPKMQKQYPCFFGWMFGMCKTTMTYTATIRTETVGVSVRKVEYSANGGMTWTKGNTYTSYVPITNLMVRVTDSNGTQFMYRYDCTNTTLVK